MKPFRRVAIVGTGLIGGSIALAIKKRKLAAEVVGVSRHRATILRARRSGAIDAGSQDLAIVKGADLVILAAPVEVIIALAPRLALFIGRECIVTDVGSTKAEIVARLGRVFSGFVGAHPLAGSEKRGIRYADAALFEGSLCLLTPTAQTDPAALRKVAAFWRALGARILVLAPRPHDRILAYVSHLPHVAAYALMNAVPKHYLKYAASGLKDTTRIAASEAELWAGIFLTNRGSLLEAISCLQLHLKKIASAVQRDERQAVVRLCRAARQKREGLE